MAQIYIRDNYYMAEIPARRLSDGRGIHIFPVKDDPAETVESKSGREDTEIILWHGERYEVHTQDLYVHPLLWNNYQHY
jgi:hypothetical protein